MTSMTLEQAKNEVWRTEDELSAFVPSTVITRRWPRAETSNVLFECGKQGIYYWPGLLEVSIDPATDTGAIVEAIYGEWSVRSDWVATWRARGEGGQYHLDLQRNDGLNVAVMNLRGNTLLHFGSFSPCFELADYDPNKPY